MNTVATLKTFSQEELLCLLRFCGESLANAYQHIQQKEFWFASDQAFQACDFIMHEIQKKKLDYPIH